MKQNKLKQFQEEIIFREAFMLKGAFDFEYRNIWGSIARFDKEINIQAIQCDNPNKGECQEFIKLFKADVEERGLTLVSSTAISDSWRHICKKFDIKIYDYPEEEEYNEED